MENQEEILDALNLFEKKPSPDIPPLLDQYLRQVAKTGETLFPWSRLKALFRCKLDQVMLQFNEEMPFDHLVPYPNVENVKFEEMRSRVLDALDHFHGAPFTIQRLCELVTDPKKHYMRSDKFLRGIEKNVMVVSTVDPFGRKIVSDSQRALVNGIDVNGHGNSKIDEMMAAEIKASPAFAWNTDSPVAIWPRPKVDESPVTSDIGGSDTEFSQTMASDDNKEADAQSVPSAAVLPEQSVKSDRDVQSLGEVVKPESMDSVQNVQDDDESKRDGGVVTGEIIQEQIAESGEISQEQEMASEEVQKKTEEPSEPVQENNVESGEITSGAMSESAKQNMGAGDGVLAEDKAEESHEMESKGDTPVTDSSHVPVVEETEGALEEASADGSQSTGVTVSVEGDEQMQQKGPAEDGPETQKEMEPVTEETAQADSTADTTDNIAQKEETVSRETEGSEVQGSSNDAEDGPSPAKVARLQADADAEVGSSDSTQVDGQDNLESSGTDSGDNNCDTTENVQSFSGSSVESCTGAQVCESKSADISGNDQSDVSSSGENDQSKQVSQSSDQSGQVQVTDQDIDQSNETENVTSEPAQGESVQVDQSQTESEHTDQSEASTSESGYSVRSLSRDEENSRGFETESMEVDSTDQNCNNGGSEQTTMSVAPIGADVEQQESLEEPMEQE